MLTCGGEATTPVLVTVGNGAGTGAGAADSTRGGGGGGGAGTGSSSQTVNEFSPVPTVMYAIGLLAFLWLIYRYKKLRRLL
jgi:hypothetical protein